MHVDPHDGVRSIASTHTLYAPDGLLTSGLISLRESCISSTDCSDASSFGVWRTGGARSRSDPCRVRVVVGGLQVAVDRRRAALVESPREADPVCHVHLRTRRVSGKDLVGLNTFT